MVLPTSDEIGLRAAATQQQFFCLFIAVFETVSRRGQQALARGEDIFFLRFESSEQDEEGKKSGVPADSRKAVLNNK